MSTTISAPASAIELRLLCAREAYLVHRLAALDDAPDLDGQVLVAIIDGQGVAALSLNDERVVANPFIPTAEAVALLRVRAAQLSNGHRGASLFRRRRPARRR
jgi:hypothetical protein